MYIKKSIVAALFCLISMYSHCQTLAVSPTQLDFGTVTEREIDSLPLTITNVIFGASSHVKIEGIRFFKTYSNYPFFTKDSVFSLNSGETKTIQIYFKPKHNIQHNSELVIINNSLTGPIAVDLLGQGKYSKTYYAATQNLAEEALKQALKTTITAGYTSLGYNTARDRMFMNIDNEAANGQGASVNILTCIYTNKKVTGYADRTAAQGANGSVFNTEHTYPQSLFSQNEPQRSDLFHLFPTSSPANNDRGDKPFAEVGNPNPADLVNYPSVNGSNTYEPQDSHKGNVARAMMYFVMRYQDYNNYFVGQQAIFKTWHNAFPPTAKDTVRNNTIFSYQKNRNPFIDYPQFIERITNLVATSTAVSNYELALFEPIIGIAEPCPADSVTQHVVLVNSGKTDITISEVLLQNGSNFIVKNTPSTFNILSGESKTINIAYKNTSCFSTLDMLTFKSSEPKTFNVRVGNQVSTDMDAVFHKSILIYPNPTDGVLKINGSQPLNKYSLYDPIGTRYFSGVMLNETNTLDLTDLPNGVYYLEIESNHTKSTQKILLVH